MEESHTLEGDPIALGSMHPYISTVVVLGGAVDSAHCIGDCSIWTLGGIFRQLGE